MPTLNWIGKDAVVNHHMKVPFRLLKDVPDLACGDPGSGNLIVQGDNLEALKALLPYYAGQVKCIYIDPPYNTGNEGWAYNDNVNSPIIRDWLGKVVGKEGETLDRHDRWLCMMYPRLALLRQFLRDDGTIFVSLDDNEAALCRLLMNEIFGSHNFIATIAWQRRISPDARLGLSQAHDHILVFGKQLDKVSFNKVPVNPEQEKNFKNPDDDKRGPWVSTDFTAPGWRPNQMYTLKSPGGIMFEPPPGRCWKNIESEFTRLLGEERMWFGKDGKARPRVKTYLSETEGVSTWTWWPHTEAGHNQEAKQEINSILCHEVPFDTPKPTRLIERILQIATNPGDLVMDSFAGSGTTGHAVLKMNAAGAVDAASSPRIGVGVDAASAPRFSETNLFDAQRGGDAASTANLQRGGDAASTGDAVVNWKTYFDPKQPIGFLRGGNLPHWRQQGATYFVTWRTADSMPAERVQRWVSERSAWLEHHPEPHDIATQAEYDTLFSGRWEQWLDESLGACELQRPEIHALMETALRSFDNDHYRLEDMAIMPNHVHVLVTPLGKHTLSDIIQNWKSYTAHAINERLGGKGSFWQKENFDHIVRNADEMARIRDYVRGQHVDAAGTLREGERGGDAASTKPRRFILVEMEPKIAREVTAERVRRVAEGYTNAKGVSVEGLGGGFRYCELGEPLFDETGMIRETVKFSELARHVFFSETGEPLPRARVLNTPLIGEYNGVGIYLLYNGILGDDSVNGGNVLTRQILAKLPPFDGPKVIYCAGCLLSRDRLQAERITIRQTPYEIKVS